MRCLRLISKAPLWMESYRKGAIDRWSYRHVSRLMQAEGAWKECGSRLHPFKPSRKALKRLVSSTAVCLMRCLSFLALFLPILRARLNRRMLTVVMKAKKKGKNNFVSVLAQDYDPKEDNFSQ